MARPLRIEYPGAFYHMTSGDGRTLSYDSEDRLTRAVKNGNVVDFAYDPDGDRIRKSTKTTIPNLTSAISLNVETIYLGNLYEIEKINGYVAKVTKHYYLNADKVASREIVNGVTQNLYFYHGDQIGSSNLITDETGNEVQHIEYYPFGEVRTNENKNNATIDVPYKFTGKELDTETDLYYYGARYYDAKLCRFITADDVVQAPYAPQTLNRYSYCSNNPVIMIDPSGHGFFHRLFKHIKKVFKKVVHAVKKVAKAVVNTLKNPKALAAIAAGFLAAPFFVALVPEGSVFLGSVAVGAGGGAIGGGVYAAETGQNIGRGMLSGAKYGGMMGAGTALMRTGWEYAKKITDSSSLKQWKGLIEAERSSLKEKGLPVGPKWNRWGELLTDGVRRAWGESKSLLSRFSMSPEGSMKNHVLFLNYNANTIIGRFINHVSKVHDLFDSWRYVEGRYKPGGMLFDTAFDVYSFAGMPVAAAYTVPGYYGTEVLTMATPVLGVDTMKNN